jgi:hypothetical protein
VDEIAAQIAELQARLEAFERNPWTKGAERGEWPRSPQVATLPTASADNWLQIVTVPGDGATTADVTYQNLRNSAGAYGWRIVATG